jgi:hypothetical protein
MATRQRQPTRVHAADHAAGTADERGSGPERTSVVKTLWPPQPGTVKLSRRFGEALLCVRYRHDRTGLRRYTTVELIVEQAPVTSRRADESAHSVHIGLFEKELRRLAMEHHATWDDATRTWRMTGATIKRLGLERQVVLPGKRK